MTTKHTPTPWQVDPGKPQDVQGPDGELEICRCMQKGDFGMTVIFPDEAACIANAVMIVRAVNHHEALVAMVSELRMLVRVTGPLTTARERADKLLAAIAAATP